MNHIPTEEELGRMIEEKYAITEADWRKQINDAVGYVKIVVGKGSDNVVPQLVVHVVDINIDIQTNVEIGEIRKLANPKRRL